MDYYMPLKFLEYNVRLMRQHISEDGHTTLPVILNICVYNGLETYNGPTNLLDICANPDWVRNYMFQSFQLVDLNRESHEQILKDKKAAFAELLLRQGIRREFYTWLKTHEQFFLNLLQEGNIPYVEEAFYYILQIDTDEQVEAKLATINPVLKELAMSAAQRLRQEGRQEGEKLGILKGRQEGRQEGEKLGVLKGAISIAKNMLQAGSDIDFIVKVTGLSKTEIANLA
jgi:predicted transposase/invertase (TIGR01784 family)